jgi:uncharacterized protein YcfJ
MRALIEILAGLAILANAVIYGTDVFGAIVQRPAIAAVDDRTLTQVMGHIHRVADRRLAAFSIGGLVAAVVTAALAAATGHWVSTAAGALAALAGRVPGNARELQARWDSVINGRVALQTLSLAALCVALAAA